jgi:hypothetical protein
MAEHPANRVVIINCGERGHLDHEYDIVVETFLTSSGATASTA